MDQKTTGSGDSVRLSYLPSSTTPITSAKGLAHGIGVVQDPPCEGQVDNGNLRGFRVVMPSKLAASEQLRSHGREKPRGNLIEGDADAVRRLQIRFVGGKDASVRLVDTERNGIRIRSGLYAGQLLDGL